MSTYTPIGLAKGFINSEVVLILNYQYMLTFKNLMYLGKRIC